MLLSLSYLHLCTATIAVWKQHVILLYKFLLHCNTKAAW